MVVGFGKSLWSKWRDDTWGCGVHALHERIVQKKKVRVGTNKDVTKLEKGVEGCSFYNNFGATNS